MNQYVGQKLGTYRLIRMLGSGGFAEVYLGKHVQTNWDVAVKILKIHYPETTFRQEAEILWKLNHPHIIKILGYDIENGISYLVMDYAAKGSLRDLHAQGDILLQPLILEYVKQIANALNYMHKQHLIHCDIKPQNFLVRDNGEVLLGDFGIATEAVTTSLRLASLPSSSKPIVGTLHYIAPEQWQGQNPTPATDQYALGVVVYEWLSGRRPFTGTNAQMIAQAHLYQPPLPFSDNNISAELEAVVTKALEKDPKDRYPSILDFAQALEDAIQNRPIFSPQQQNTPQNPGHAIWGQLYPQNPSTPSQSAGVYNSQTIPVTPPMMSQSQIQGGMPFRSGSYTTTPVRRKVSRFDWENLRETSTKLFVLIGCICDFLCTIPLFLALNDLNWAIGLPLLAIVARFLCAAAVKSNVARLFAWALTLYETLVIVILLIHISSSFYILAVIVAIIAWLGNDFFYARKK